MTSINSFSFAFLIFQPPFFPSFFPSFFPPYFRRFRHSPASSSLVSLTHKHSEPRHSPMPLQICKRNQKYFPSSMSKGWEQCEKAPDPHANVDTNKYFWLNKLYYFWMGMINRSGFGKNSPINSWKNPHSKSTAAAGLRLIRPNIGWLHNCFDVKWIR